MNRHFASSLTLAALLSAPLLANDDIKAENALTRPVGAPDADATGHVRVEIDVSKDRHRLKVEAEHIDTSLVFELFLADAGGTLQNVGVMPFDDVGEVEIEFDSKEGPALPFGVTNVNTLGSRAVEVRSGGATYLIGTVPFINGGGGGGGGGGDDGSGGGGGGNDVKVKSFLSRSASSPDSNVTGYVELRDKGVGDQKFKVEADHVDVGVAFSVFVETSLGSGIMANAGSMVVEDVDDVELELETENGAVLPNAATDIAQLAGLRVEVRDAANAIYLEGVVPAMSGGSNDDGKTNDDFTGSGGKAQVKLQAKKGNQRFELEVKKLKLASNVNLFVMNAPAATFTQVATIDLNGGGNGKYRVETKKGQALPLGAAALSTLGGVAFEVRDATSGVVLITGQIPQL